MQSREYIETWDSCVECYIDRMTLRFALVMSLGLFQFGCSHSQVGFVEGPTRVLASSDYETPSGAKDADCHIIVGARTPVKILGPRTRSQGWNFDASNVEVLEGPFIGLKGYIATRFILHERGQPLFDLSSKIPFAEPCVVGYQVNEAFLNKAIKTR
jgi:hypothetical protein